MKHSEQHFDARGHCQCSCRDCQGNEGRCLCATCPCSRIGQCEADDGCPRCRNYTVTA